MNHKTGLIIYYYYHHHLMIERLAASMIEYGVEMDVICMDNLRFVQNSNIRFSFAQQSLFDFFEKCESRFFFRLVRKMCSSYLLKNLLSLYNQIDFHAYSLGYIPLMEFCQKKVIPFDITVWGSDIMRASDEELEKKKWGFEHCRFIKSSENLHQVVDEKYPGLFKGKFKTCYFGNSDFEVIDSISESAVCDYRKTLLGTQEEVIVTCGYNGSVGQNHLSIVEAIKDIPIDIKKRVSFLFPMTYGASPEYLASVKQALNNAKVHYTIIDKYLPSEEVAKIRLASDVVVNIQKTDAFSGSLKEHLYCNNVLIIGEWLNYVPLDKAEVYYIKSSISELRTKLTMVLKDYGDYKKLCYSNHEKLWNITSWSAVLPLWAETYNS